MNTRQSLLDTAAELVRTRGYNGFSYADLAVRLGLRKPSIHHHFPTKEDLGRALVEAYTERFDVAIEAIRRGAGTAPEQLHAYAQLYRESMVQDRGCLCGVLASELDALPPAIAEGVRRFMARQTQWLGERIAAGQALGEIGFVGNPSDAASALLAACQGALLVARSQRDPSRFDQAMTWAFSSLFPRD